MLHSLGWWLPSNGRWQSLVIGNCLYRDPPIGCPPLRMTSLSASDLPEFTLLFKAHLLLVQISLSGSWCTQLTLEFLLQCLEQGTFLPFFPTQSQHSVPPASPRVEPHHCVSMQKQVSNLKFINSGNLGSLRATSGMCSVIDEAIKQILP